MSLKTVTDLTKLIEKDKRESNFAAIKLYVASKESTNIILYEDCADESCYYTVQKERGLLREFTVNTGNPLTGPSEITFWKIVKDFKYNSTLNTRYVSIR